MTESLFFFFPITTCTLVTQRVRFPEGGNQTTREKCKSDRVVVTYNLRQKCWESFLFLSTPSPSFKVEVHRVITSHHIVYHNVQ